MTMSISNSLKKTIRQRAGASFILSTLILSFARETVAFNPQENPNGIRWQSSSSEAWSGTTQSDGSGNRAQLAGAYDGSPDTVNPQGVTGYLGLLDPIFAPITVTPTPSPTGLSPTPTSTASPSASPTPTSTATALPTLTPTEGPPTLTATPTCFITDEDYDLNGDNQVGAEDLLLFIQAMERGTGTVDFNCDGSTDVDDLFLMSQKWEINL
jgi:hypothetical protein